MRLATWCPWRPYSGHPGTGVQLQDSGATIVGDPFGVIAMNPMSKSGAEPENTGPAATGIEFPPP